MPTPHSRRSAARPAPAALATLLLLATLLSLLPALGPGLPHGRDTIFELVRIAEFARGLEDGVIPPRWASNFFGGYGYPIFVFFPPLFLMLAGGLVRAGLSTLAALELGYAVLAFVAAGGMYRLARTASGPWVAMLAATAYVLAPYRFFDAWVISASAQLSALSVAPWLFVGLLALVRGNPSTARGVAGGAIAVGLFALTHVLSMIMFAPLALAVVVLELQRHEDRRGAALRVLAGAGLGVALAAFFLVPMLARLGDLARAWQREGATHITEALLDGSALLSMPYLPIMLWTATLALLTAYGLTLRWRRGEPCGQVLLLLIVGLLAFVLSTSWSAPLWSTATPLHFFLYPGRWLGVSTFCFCWSSAGALEAIHAHRPRWTAPAAAIVGTVLVETSVLLIAALGPRVEQPQMEAPELLRSERVTTTVADEYVPATVLRLPSGSAYPSAVSRDAQVEPLVRRSHALVWRVHTPTEAAVLLRHWWFPGWEVRIDGSAAAVELTPEGTPVVVVPSGQHLVEMVYVGTTADILGRLLTGLATAALLGLVLVEVRSGRPGPTTRREAQGP